ncbi:uncharacterized protein LOC126790955 [Argentina anserina]|uniref:uncharacterized protein LOC126790955 n=1 Tax=Argentina anserina TaxID=57926 RepID=UPI0021768932|nr:uncharacterized protein LOC126790955 [Potentilla anserina]
MSRRNKGKTEKDQVEELLRAAQDDMLLSVSVDSHISRLSDVDRRFQALKLNKVADALKSPPPKVADSSAIQVDVDHELKAVLGDDLSARFAALKASMPMPSSSMGPSSALQADDDPVDEDDEVEKLIRWAKDAARLDPSPPSDDED